MMPVLKVPFHSEEDETPEKVATIFVNKAFMIVPESQLRFSYVHWEPSVFKKNPALYVTKISHKEFRDACTSFPPTHVSKRPWQCIEIHLSGCPDGWDSGIIFMKLKPFSASWRAFGDLRAF